MMRKAKQLKREEARERAAARAKRSDAQQLAFLERNGHGHCREARELRKKLQEKKVS